MWPGRLWAKGKNSLWLLSRIDRGHFNQKTTPWSDEVKRRIAQESFEGTGSVTQLGKKSAVNTNQIFKWRKDNREKPLENSGSINPLPITVSREVVVKEANPRNTSCQASSRTLRIELPQGNLRITGCVPGAVLRAALECVGMIGIPAEIRIWIVAVADFRRGFAGLERDAAGLQRLCENDGLDSTIRRNGAPTNS